MRNINNITLPFLFIAVIGSIAYLIGTDLYERRDHNQEKPKEETRPVAQEECIPTFADGGGPYYLPDSPFRQNIAPEDTGGKQLVVSGRILQNDCQTPVPNAVLDIWQADETGEYRDEWYRGRVQTDANGNYTFETVVPQGYGEGTGYRPPHIHFKVFVEDQEIITSQMFFPEVRGTRGFDDAYIMKVDGTNGYHDIILP